MHPSFQNFLQEQIQNNGLPQETIYAVFAAFLEDIYEVHSDGYVANIENGNFIIQEKGRLLLHASGILSPRSNWYSIDDINQKTTASTFEISTGFREEYEDGEVVQKNIFLSEELPQSLVYVPNYSSYELVIGHHDPLSDVFLLGMILASLVFGLDFRRLGDLERFVENRSNLFVLRPKLHPSIVKIIFEMTELDRKKRPVDLLDILIRLQNYKDFSPNLTSDLSDSDGFIKSDVSDKNQWILQELKSRLFNLTRRNRLLYFKPQLRFINLTVASVPDEADVNLISVDDLFIWNDEIKTRIQNGSKISINKYLSFQEKNFLVKRLKKIGADARKDVQEFGFHQLKLAIAFLNWSNIEEKERIQSPLLLVPVNLVAERGAPIKFHLDIQADIVEVNPVLAYALKDRYGIELPDFLDLNQSSLDDFFTYLHQQITNKINGVIFNWAKQPKINLLHKLSNESIYRYVSRLAKKDDVPKEKIKRKTSFKIEHTLNENLFLWEMDTCQMVLGNFNYKKMSLVFDYDEIANKQIGNVAFERMFNSEQIIEPRHQDVKTLENQKVGNQNLRKEFHILTSDPTQKMAVQMALKDDDTSYVIQGPPGTGKSQTITNLIANLVAHGKKVLFVCEKRVALDVVFYKLEQAKLGELCCLVHDTKSDKKSFIFDLKDVYEDYLQFPLNFEEIERERFGIIQDIQIEWTKVEDFQREMMGIHPESGIPLFELYSRGAYLMSNDTPMKESVNCPFYKDWLKSETGILELYQKMADLKFYHLSNFPLHPFSVEWFGTKDDSLELLKYTQSASDLVKDIELNLNQLPNTGKSTVYELQVLANQALQMGFMIKNPELLDLFDSKSSISDKFRKQQKELILQEEKLNSAQKENEFWINKISFQKTKEALSFMKEKEGRFFSFLNGRYRKLKTVINRNYDFSKHIVKPTYVDVLNKLMKEHDIKNQLIHSKTDFEKRYNISDDVFQSIEDLRHNEYSNIWISHLKNNPNKFATILKIYEQLDELETIFVRIYDDIYKKTLAVAKSEMDALLEVKNQLDLILPLLKKISISTPNLLQVIKTKPISIVQLEFEIIKNTIDSICSKNPRFSNKTGNSIQKHISKTAKLHQKLMQINAEYIRSFYRKRFNKKVWITERSASVLEQKEKEIKKIYKRGRRILEHEFSKKMRYKSIRELTSLESKDVIFDLKPVWLMSPLSVSDVVPLDTQNFDVVIFDEASQITLEEGIPALFRAKKAIIVGDEMQMPPTNFFSAKKNTDEEEIEGEGVYLDVDSLLTQAARKMESVRLGWHYRSRHESLINFSNAAFYHGSLLTIPDVRNTALNCGEISVEFPDVMPVSLRDMLHRPISYHYLENGIYTNRSNPSEAEYIAHLVREMIFSDYKLTIGIVAFSQKQQGEIEKALEQLAQEDERFEELLEAENIRHENGQFIGLFVKNLENVQGDERDIMILSICYGKNTQGKMRMNFGPINREGGEKRLNVIFSRAKKHMAVITSLRSEEITNDYNPGAMYFKKFLKYAFEISSGNQLGAQKVLNGLSKLPNRETSIENVIAQKMGKYFISKGYHVDYNIGQSDFVCHLGVKRNEHDTTYAFGILIDDSEHYHNQDSFAQNLQKPMLMESFGWDVYRVFVKDWWEDWERVLDKFLTI